MYKTNGQAPLTRAIYQNFIHVDLLQSRLKETEALKIPLLPL